MALKIIQKATSFSVDVEEAKWWCRNDIVGDVEDAVFDRLIANAKEKLENIVGRTLVEQKYRLSLDAFPVCFRDRLGIKIPMPPLRSIDSFKYTNEAGEVITLTEDDYLLDDESEPSWIFPAYGTSWPAARAIPNAVKIEFTAGYADADTLEKVPESANMWMLSHIVHWYRNREAYGDQLFINPDFNGQLDSLRVLDF